MQPPALRRRRSLTLGLLAVLSLLALTPARVLAYDKVDHQQPQTAGTALAYYIREANSQDAPQAGRTVTMRVQSAPGTGASVAPADASRHAVGPQGNQASTKSGADGLAYFALELSPTPGENQFVWDDGVFTGLVVVAGTPAPAGTHPPPVAVKQATQSGPSGVLGVLLAALIATVVAAAVTVFVGGLVFLSGVRPFRLG
ncbi:MAG TPA: hypothetical protein VH134_09475 [Candidatus Dormibacteraeota bacterium]|jgi:hypothetical protein|nr:hypothetical protein [Candidatus Dormibacteraeota bacterium]